jgi:xylan 1,4-beta-xylosidase
MRGDRVEASSSGAMPIQSILVKSVREKPDIDVLASRDDHGISVLAWNYFDEDIPSSDASVMLQVDGVPKGTQRVLMKHYRIDATHSNSYSAWKAMGSPQNPTADQQRQLEDAGQLQLLESPGWLRNESGTLSIRFDLPRQGVSLIRLDW